ncbi:MAG TPA: arginine--tRNA ligase [Thermoanaerobaculia bacterium]|nr:arginine--tRNA ligase [Thermoanaerobaculia bacterium]
MILEDITQQLTETLKSRVLALFGHPVERVVLQTPPKLNMGDLATPIALELAKVLKRKPREIAEQLANGLTLPALVATVTVEGAGYLNFRFDRGAFTAQHFRGVLAPPPASGERVIVEHTNINPNKAAHIGHLRNAVLGDTYVRCSKWLGDRVETQNYIDDTGVQVADVVVAFERLEQKSLADVEELIKTSPRFDYVCWDVYSKMAQYYADHPESLEWRRETLHRIEHQEGETAILAATIARAIVRRHLETMLRLGIRYDLLPKESDIIHMHFWDRAFELLRNAGALVMETEGKHQGCWVMKLDESAEFAGMENADKILVRSNGTVTYTGKDIAYQLWKLGLLDRTFDYRKFPFEYPLWETTHSGDGDPSAPKFGAASRVVNVIDSRQSYLQKVVKEGVRQVVGAKAAEASIHFAYEMVALTPATAKVLGMELSADDQQRAYVEMSGRKGLGVKADDMLDELERKAAAAVAQNEELSGDEAALVGRQVAIAALRYFMLRYGRNKVIAFDFDEALRFEGDSGPYLQYSTVRVQNIFRKMKERGVDPRIDEPAVDDLTLNQGLTDEMWELVKLSAELPSAIRRAVDSLELSVVTQYLLEMAQKFNSFYHKYPIMNEKEPAERQRRAVCAEVFRRTMVGAMDLLGIPVPERM